MALTESELSLRRQETDELERKLEQMNVRVSQLLDRLYAGTGDMTPQEWDKLVGDYHVALKVCQDCESRLNDFRPWDELDREQRQKRKKIR